MEKLILGQKIIRLDEVNSTNQFAKELGSYINPIREGTVILADNQLEGRGRHNKSWVSHKGENISMSIILFPEFLSASKLFYLSKVIALSVAQSLIDLRIKDVKVKWPNDIYIGEKKVAGILIETSWKGSIPQECIIGIGINVNQTDFSQVKNPVTSLRLNARKQINRDDLLSRVISSIEDWYHRLRLNQWDFIDESYREMLFKLNEEVRFMHRDNEIKGTVLNVIPDGKLQLRRKNGEVELFDLDELTFIHEVRPIS